jgi:PRC-barrel domain
MSLMTIDEYSGNPSGQADIYRIKGFSVHSDLTAGMLTNKTEEKLGMVADVLLNATGQIEYVVVSLGNSTTSRMVLLPADRARIDAEHQVVYASAMSKDQAEALPEFDPAAKR